MRKQISKTVSCLCVASLLLFPSCDLAGLAELERKNAELENKVCDMLAQMDSLRTTDTLVQDQIVTLANQNILTLDALSLHLEFNHRGWR